MGAQMSPLPWFAMNAIISGVVLVAAETRSASFSRLGSSATMTIFPAAMSAMMSSTGLKMILLIAVYVILAWLGLKINEN